MEEQKYIKIYNPTEQLVKINYKGSNEELEPNESKIITAELAAHWFRIHGFLELAPVKVLTEKEEKVLDPVVVEEEPEIKQDEKKTEVKKTNSKKK